MKCLPSLYRRMPKVVVGLAGCTVAAHATTIDYYSSRALFDAAEAGLPLEHFQILNPPAFTGSEPVSSTANNSAFAAGNILPGIAIGEMNLVGLYAYDGPAPVLNFSPGVPFETDVFGASGANPLAGTITLTILNGTTQLGSQNYNQGANQTDYIGFNIHQRGHECAAWFPDG